jgi:energy-coupling factor transporter transmembrane protein EcfT
VTILGVNTESLALSIVAVVLSVLLAAAVLARVWARRVLLAVATFGLVFAAGDGRELVHQLDDSNAGLAVVAGLLIGLHLMVALLAASLLTRRTGREGSPVVTPAG